MRLIIPLLIFSFTLFSCKKEKAKSKTTLLTQAVWHPVTVLGRTSRYHFPDMPVTIEACDLDNVFGFATTGYYSVTDGASTCSDTSPISPESGIWEFAQDETYIMLHVTTPSGTITKDCNIEILDENTLRYTFYDPDIILYYQCTFSH